MNRWKVLPLMMVGLLLFTSCGSKERLINMSTGSFGGTYYPIGGAIAQIVTDNVDDLTVNAQVGNASIANIQLLHEGQIETALVQNNVAFWAYGGLNFFKGSPVSEIRAIASLYTEAIQVIVTLESGAESIEDLKGLRVNLGTKDSGIYFDALNILEAYGMDETDFESEYMTFGDASNALKEGLMDAAFVTAGIPTASVIEVQLNKDIRLLSFGQPLLDMLQEQSPYYDHIIIPAGTYLKMDTEVVIPTVKALWVVREDVDEALVYEMTKAFWENLSSLKGVHEVSVDIHLSKALKSIGIPLHEGALRYYKEVGLQ